MTSIIEEGKPVSLTEQLRSAQVLLLDGENSGIDADHDGNTGAAKVNPLVEALSILEKLQDFIQKESLFSLNETLPDIQTSSLPLLSVEYHMAKAYLQLRATTSLQRNNYVRRAVDYFHIFLHRCDSLDGTLEEYVKKQYADILALVDDGNEDSESFQSLPSPTRDEKIARYRQTKKLQQKIAHMNAQLEQRKRLNIEENEDLDGWSDEDSLLRSLHLNQLNEWALNSFEELFSSNMELQMLQMAVKMEQDRMKMDRHRGSNTDGDRNDRRSIPMGRNRVPPNPDKKMKLTQVTQDPVTGQLIFNKQEVQSTIFRPSWNQPTMTLEELAEKEVRDALERDARQKEAEKKSKNAARRYEFLVKDGLEDNADLVDQSAKKDREWDDWKDDNPRGSGNKLGDRGDRNF